MRAMQFRQYGPADVVEIAEVPDPHATAGTVRIAVRASGLGTGELRIRAGDLRNVVPVAFPFRMGFDATGIVDEVGDGVEGVAVGDEVFGWTDPTQRGANAELAVLTAWARKPASWSWEEAGGAAGSVETATRVLDIAGTAQGDIVLVHGAAGATGSVIVQVAAARGAHVIGTASERNHEFLRELGAVPTAYGDGMIKRVRALAPDRLAAVIDCAGEALPDLVAIAGDAAKVITIADPSAATHGVRMSSGATDELAEHGLAEAAALADAGQLSIPVAAVFPYSEAVAAQELSETRHARGKIVLIPDARP
ncbi:NADP-dependent oxidoreductase [Nocardioides sp. NPDC087217]|uniref:NADP-dependent oxidoreductase n=1 Tax=Nocardioides sp. NPDC087217 TaxID=3364335 RepID=UPI003822CE52